MTPVTSAHPLQTLALKSGSKLEIIPEGQDRGDREKGFLSFVPSGDTGYRAASVDSCKYLTREHFPVPQPLTCHLKYLVFIAFGHTSLPGQCLCGTPLSQQEAASEDSPFLAAKTMSKGPNQDKESQTKLRSQMNHPELDMEIDS